MPDLNYTVGLKLKVDKSDIKKIPKDIKSGVNIGFGLGSLTKLTAVMNVISGMVGSIMSMLSNAFFGSGPIKALMNILQTILNLALLPLVMVLFYIFKPILLFILRIMIGWWKLWQKVFGHKGNNPITSPQNLKKPIESPTVTKNPFSSIISGVTNTNMKQLQTSVDTFNNYLNKLKDSLVNNVPVIGPALATIVGWFQKFEDDLISGNFLGVLEDIFSLFSTVIPQVIKDLAVGFGTALADALKQIVKGILSFVDKLKTKAKEYYDKLVIFIKDLWKAVRDFGRNIKNAFDAVVNYINGLIGKAKRAIEEAIPKPVKNAVNSLGHMVFGHDVVITNKGDIVHLDPNDTIYASKSGMGNVNINIQGVVDEHMVDYIAMKLARRGQLVSRW